MRKYSVIIVDDEPLALDVLSHYLSLFPTYEVLGRYTNPLEAWSYIQQNDVDLVITDIAMPKLSGIDLIKLAKGKTRFVITTSYSDFALESFELNVADYLLKPVSTERFSKMIDHFEDSITKATTSEQTFYVKDGEEYVKVIVDDIDYIEGMRDYAKIVCGKNFYMVLKTLKSLESFLKPFEFARVHKSFIIPLKKIKQFNNRVVIIEEHEVPVSATYREVVKDYLNERRI